MRYLWMVGLFAIDLCAQTQQKQDLQMEEEIADPFEGPNRVIFSFNRIIDGLFLKPAAILYDQVMPQIFKKAFKNVRQNLGEVTNVAYYALQGEGHKSLKSAGRFVLNTSVGLGGLIDVAREIDLSPEDTNMGKTLKKWGAKPGFYLVIPILGPSSLRDGIGLAVTTTADPWYYAASNKHRAHNHHKQQRKPLYGIYAVDLTRQRANLIDITDDLERSVDPYVATRSYYAQHQQDDETQ